MGKHSKQKLYLVFAAWTFLAVGIVVGVVTILQLEGIRGQAEDDALTAVRQTVLPILGDSGAVTPASLGDSAAGLLSQQFQAVRLWSADGNVLALAGRPVQPNFASVVKASREGETAGKASAPQGDVLVSYTRLDNGAVLEIQQDYAPIAASIADGRWRLGLMTTVSTAVVLVLLQTILWAATRSLRGEYDRLLYLFRSGQAIRSTLDLTGVMEQIGRDAALYTRAELGLTTLVEEEGDELVLKASFDTKTITASQHHRKVEAWFLRRCAATGEPVVAEQDTFPYVAVMGYQPTEEHPVNILCVPIPGRNRVSGIITVVRGTEHGAFRAHEVQLLEEMAAQGGMAVEQATLFTKVRDYAEEVEISYDGTLRVLMAALDTKDSVTQGHSERVARLTVALAKEVGVPQERLVDIERGALLHDVGKIGVPDAILQKPGSLDEKEWEAMQKHPLLAGLMVSKVSFLEGALPILLYHHERFDGTGYPFSLKGDAIPLEARIFTVIDAYDAMTFDRPYRKAMTSAVALAEIQRNADIQFDPEVVDAFTRLIGRMDAEEQRAA